MHDAPSPPPRAELLRAWRAPRALLAASVAATLVACSAPPPAAASGAFPAEPFATVVSDAGAFHAEVRTAPSQPPARGESQIELTLTDAHGQPADGLTLDAVPWMVSMGHGSSVEPTVTPEGGGRYRLDHVDLFMAGRWVVRVTITEPVHDVLDITFDVP